MKKTLLALALSVLCLAQTTQAAFDDVPAGHPYFQGISYLELIGAVDPGANFRPDDLVSRAEFFKILFKTLHEESENIPHTFSFDDVPEGSWFEPYADLALYHGLMSGDFFEGSKTLSRGNVLSSVMQAYGLGAPVIPVADRDGLFVDVGPKHPLYSLIYQANKVGIVTANENNYYLPYSKLTRGELADLLYRADSWKNETMAASAEQDFYKADIFAAIWNSVLTDFYLPSGYEIDQEVLFEAAVGGLLESLNDPYSTYFSADAASEFNDSLSGEFEGIGAMLTQDAENLEVFITSVLEGSPAEEAGLQAGDKIVKVDDVSIEGMSLEEVLSRIKGAADTEVRVTIERGTTQTTYRLIRARLELDLVKGSIYDKTAWLIDIETFGANISEEIDDTFAELEAEEPTPSAVIFDLRGNPGGYVNMSNYIAGLFLPELTPIMVLDYGDFKQEMVNAADGPYQGIPIYILVDQYSASASEILSLSLQEMTGATVIGTQTFGKGSAQELLTYWDGSLLKLTIAHWLSAKGTSIQGVGVTPDIEITPVAGGEDEWLEALDRAL